MTWGTEQVAIMGWLVAVLVEVEGSPERRYFVVAEPDQGRAEWSAVDQAMLAGHVASSPIKGQEPVEAVRALTAPTLRAEGVAAGAVKPLGPRPPRRWLAPA